MMYPSFVYIIFKLIVGDYLNIVVLKVVTTFGDHGFCCAFVNVGLQQSKGREVVELVDVVLHEFRCLNRVRVQGITLTFICLGRLGTLNRIL